MAFQDLIINPQLKLNSFEFKLNNGLFKAKHLNINDKVSSNLSENKLKVYFTRYVSTEIENNFNIKVEYQIDWDVKEKEELKKHLESGLNPKDSDYMLADATNESSLVISQILKGAELPTFIPPPYLITDKEPRKTK